MSEEMCPRVFFDATRAKAGDHYHASNEIQRGDILERSVFDTDNREMGVATGQVTNIYAPEDDGCPPLVHKAVGTTDLITRTLQEWSRGGYLYLHMCSDHNYQCKYGRYKDDQPVMHIDKVRLWFPPDITEGYILRNWPVISGRRPG